MITDVALTNETSAVVPNSSLLSVFRDIVSESEDFSLLSEVLRIYDEVVESSRG